MRRMLRRGGEKREVPSRSKRKFGTGFAGVNAGWGAVVGQGEVLEGDRFVANRMGR